MRRRASRLCPRSAHGRAIACRCPQPSYKATRVPTEVTFEALPQTVLQTYIYVRVMSGGASNLALYAAVLPVSICLSILSMLKTWAEVLVGARLAGVSIGEYMKEMTRMGGGLQLDAIRKSAIEKLEPGYTLEPVQVTLLADALAQNASLTEVNLNRCGLGDDGIKQLIAPLLGIPTLTEI